MIPTVYSIFIYTSMPSRLSDNPPENHATYDYMWAYYLDWLDTYEKLKTETDELKLITYHDVAIDRFQKALECMSEWIVSSIFGWKSIKLDILLLLAELHDEKSEKQKSYFDAAVLLFWKSEHCLDWEYKGKIIAFYLSFVDSTYQQEIKNEKQSYVREILLKKIISESKNRANDRESRNRRDMQSVGECLSTNPSPADILKELEKRFGSLNLAILSENSGEIIFEQRSNLSREDIREKWSTLSVDIFNKSSDFRFVVSRTDSENSSGFNDHERENIITPMLELFVKNTEQPSFMNVYAHTLELETIEKDMRLDAQKYDYSAFVEDIFWKLTTHRPRNQERYAENFLKALDICRMITLGSTDVLVQIDTILEGKIDGDVLDITKTMLLSRHETADGLGYPFRLSRKKISLEWRIYPIIQAYESLLSSVQGDQTKALETMETWAQDGYFDRSIFRIFSDNLKAKGAFPKIPHQESIVHTAQDSEKQKSRITRFYHPFLHSARQIIELTREIGGLSYQGRMAIENTDRQRKFFAHAAKLKSTLRKAADITTKLIIIRHGTCASDIPGEGRKPGSPDERLILLWVEQSIQKWIEFQHEILRYMLGPYDRTEQTGGIIHKTIEAIKSGVQDLVSHEQYSRFHRRYSDLPQSPVSSEKTITNPAKHSEWTMRENWPLWQMIADCRSDDLKWMLPFVDMLKSLSWYETNLIVTHGDTAMIIINLLRHTIDAISLKNDKIYEFTIRWGEALSEEQEKTQGFVCGVENRESVIAELNILMREIFWDVFYDPDKESLNIKSLHNRLICVLNTQYEKSPNAFKRFMHEIQANAVTQHIHPILSTALRIE